MTSRPPERAELDTLLDPLLRFARDMLKKHGEFYPFGATIASDGQMEMTGGDTGKERPESQEVIDLMVEGMRSRAEAGSIRAAAICFDTKLGSEGGDPSDAIAVSLEHRAGDHALVAQPYSRGRFLGWRFGRLVALAPPEPRIFVSKVTNAQG